MKKPYMGVRLKRLREERGMSQAALARSLELSPSYLNQMERNQRPLTVPVLLRLNAVFGLDVQLFSEAEEARLIPDLRAALADQGVRASMAEMREITSNMPGVARAIIDMQTRLRETAEQVDVMAGHLTGAVSGEPAPFEAVRDYFYNNRNYISALDEAAEALGLSVRPGRMAEGLTDRLAGRHGIRVATEDDASALRRFDPQAGMLILSSRLTSGQRAFQMATQLGFLEQGNLIEQLARDAEMASDDARALLQIGLANYFAGAVILPYGAFLEAAETEGYDIERLAHRFGVGFETTCHRLSTLQRPEARGVPFFFIRVDRAGNISKRQSATDFHFSRIGGSCPLWNVYEAFARPGEVLTQVAQMPDGRSYLWVARTVSHGSGGYGAPVKRFAVALGCDLVHAERLVYSRGLDLRNPDLATPIGAGCKICDRRACPQRAFPMTGRPVLPDPKLSRLAPYSSKEAG
ncbi:short-chain fatty acyl-CoA regulator family protein [Lentibacter sp. XHP0401]|jgi:XRE family transcriptional regulator, fatty acid utilization regulator|uniref:short-chain fatty acyl-CoA regulator family protein n=1 Tax=Lentibacter sp. XHP0401 TaxID=2984334 RepID=UPI0021E8E569|nr:short-chain fatty acyl-CoA regulator family protein [Lentibacter sp. XHP0401]MCV2894325.1 short-chain fatty acyl-CoA regulator family protein [Lentibacter sp. XHP0401]